jgi:hypothetical protein
VVITVDDEFRIHKEAVSQFGAQIVIRIFTIFDEASQTTTSFFAK